MMLLSGLLTTPGPASLGDEAAGRLSGDIDVDVPGEVYGVQTVGSWRDGSRAGTYRVVTLRGGLDHVQTVVVIQWMEQGLGQAVPSVVAARRVEVLDDLGPIAVVAIQAMAVPNGLHLSIQVRNAVSGEEGSVEAFAGAPGRLTSEYASANKR